MSRVSVSSFVLLLLAAAGFAGCATSGGSGPGQEKFGNLLVIGIAGSWDSRAQFERVVVSGLRAAGVSAQSYILIAEDAREPTRDDVLTVIDESGFDGVLVTRVLVTRVLDTRTDAETRSATASAKVTRKDSGFMKLFRYDYEELGEPPDLMVNVQVDFLTELYSSASQELVWSSETKAPKSENVAVLVDESARLVVRNVRRSGRLAR